MRRLVAIDSNVFVWGIKGVSSPGQEPMIEKTKAFLSHLWKNNGTVIIPSPVIGEVLTPVPVNEHGSILAKLDRTIIIAPFDLPAAAKFAEMVAAYRSNKGLQDYKEEHRIPREVIKIDYMIAAIAVVRKVDCIYSEDNHFATFAKGFIDVKKIPIVGGQQELNFEKKESPRTITLGEALEKFGLLDAAEEGRNGREPNNASKIEEKNISKGFPAESNDESYLPF